MTKSEMIIFPEYDHASNKFRMKWTEYKEVEGAVKHEIVTMVNVLEKNNMTRTQAIQKIISDHQDLEGFSRATIYREIPKEMKQKYDRTKLQNKNVSRETFESEGLKGLRDSKGIKEQSANQEPEEQEITYDTKFVNSLIIENKNLKEENFRLKKDIQELETKYTRLLNKKRD